MRRSLSLAIGVAVSLVLLLAGCTQVFFQPEKELLLTPDKVGIAYQDVALEAADGTALHGWFLPAAGERLGSLLFFHGNAENISTHLASVAWLPAAGVDVLLIDYRGYGRSAGTPDLDGVHLDAAAAIDAFLARDEVDPAKAVIFGQSLGGAIAIEALARHPQKDAFAGLVVEGAFADYRRIAREKLAAFWLTRPLRWPLGFTVDGDYRPEEAIARLSPLPVLIVHGEVDRVIPPAHGEALFAAAKAPKTLWLMPGVDHIQAFSSLPNRRRLIHFLKQLWGAGADKVRGTS
jgi:fermentation-respiration switch protein FrsA (DUF1100 family)